MFNWVVVGVGDIARRRVIPAIVAEPRSHLYGIVTRDRKKGEAFDANVWTELDRALLDPAVDAVYIATPVYLHAPQTNAALAAGKHVLCEKPTALNYTHARSMLDAAEQNGKMLGVAYYRRGYPKLQRAKALLDAGAIGRPVLAEANCHSWFQDQDQQRSWLLDPHKSGGGPLFDIASHRIDALNFLFGDPSRATGQMSNVVHHSAVEDAATVLIEYPSGVRGIVDVRWHSHVARDEFRVIGTDGELDLNPLSGPLLITPNGREELPCAENVHYPCVANFVDAVLNGTPLLASASSSICTDWVTEQVMRQNHRVS